MAIVITACGGSPDNSTPSNQDTNLVKTEEVPGETKLPRTDCISIANVEYEVDEKLAEIKSTANEGQILSIVMTTDEELFLEISYEDTGLDESWQIDVPLENRFGFEVKVEYTDANHDDIKDELVIWWNQSDGTNGMLDGFEASSSGIIIFDVMQRNVMLNFVYDNHNASYSAGKNANTNADDYHAKMAEDTEWEICSYFYTVQLVNGELILSDFERQIEGMGECLIMEYQSGTYRYNNVEQMYELVKE